MLTPHKPLASFTSQQADHPLLDTLVQAGAAYRLEIAPDGILLNESEKNLPFLEEETSSQERKNFLAFLTTEEIQPFSQAISRVYRTGEPSVRRVSMNIREGSTFWVLLTNPYPWIGRVGASSTNRPIEGLTLYIFSNETGANLSLDWLQSHRLTNIGAVAAGTAHDLNNLFTGALTFTSILEKRISDETDKSHLHLVEKSLQRATQLTTALLHFVKEGDGETLPIDPVVCLRDITHMIERTLPQRITLSLSLPKRSRAILFRHGELCQVVMNLLINARDAIKKTGHIEVEARYDAEQDAKKFYLIVSDNGQGIVEAEASQVFDPFFTTKGRENGTGLGLAIVKKIVESYRGTVSFQSIPGKRTTFTLSLPLA